MPILALPCPHCASERMTFDFIREQDPGNGERLGRSWKTLFVCRHCWGSAVVRLRPRDLLNNRAPGSSEGNPLDEEFDLIDVYPKPQSIHAPEHIPEGIAKDFKEAAGNLRSRHWTSAGMMFRKVLQRATTALAPNGVAVSGKTLQERIDVLAALHLVTPAMREWAHVIRWDGNEATHEEDVAFSDRQANRMRDFVEMFLIYGFTMPARVAAYRQQADATD